MVSEDSTSRVMVLPVTASETLVCVAEEGGEAAGKVRGKLTSFHEDLHDGRCRCICSTLICDWNDLWERVVDDRSENWEVG